MGNDFHVIALTETWLHIDIFNNEIFPQSMEVFRFDRDSAITGKTRCGGVILAVNKKFVCAELDISCVRNSAPLVEIVACKMVYNGYKVNLVCVYIPPNTPVLTYECFLDALSLYCINLSNIVVVGDFNFANLNDNENSKLCTLFANFSAFSNLKQQNSIFNCDSKVLDLIYSDFREILITRVDDPLTTEDPYHPALNMYMLRKPLILQIFQILNFQILLIFVKLVF